MLVSIDSTNIGEGTLSHATPAATRMPMLQDEDLFFFFGYQLRNYAKNIQTYTIGTNSLMRYSTVIQFYLVLLILCQY